MYRIEATLLNSHKVKTIVMKMLNFISMHIPHRKTDSFHRGLVSLLIWCVIVLVEGSVKCFRSAFCLPTFATLRHLFFLLSSPAVDALSRWLYDVNHIIIRQFSHFTAIVFGVVAYVCVRESGIQRFSSLFLNLHWYRWLAIYWMTIRTHEKRVI